MRDELKEIKWVPIKDVKPNEKNRNKHPKEQIDRLAMIIERHGWRHPLIVSEQSGKLVIGHGRLQAAQKLKLKEVPVMVQKFNSPEEEFEVSVADNAIPTWAELDLSGIQSDLPDFDPTLLNLDALGLKDFRFEPLEPGKCDEDEVPERVEPRTKLGDLYTLGEHRLLCGDATNIQHVERLMDGNKADMVFTDPPYGISINAAYGDRMKGRGPMATRSKKVYSDIIGDDSDFDPSWIFGYFKEQQIFLWGANNYAQKLPKGSWLVWYKKLTPEMKKMYGWDFELCWTNQSAGSVYEQAWAAFLGHNKKLDGDTKTHPSMKSVSLIEKIFNDYPATTVVDVYGGSGSTLIACEKTNRKCFMCELDPYYVDIIVARWEKYTGKKAILNDSTT